MSTTSHRRPEGADLVPIGDRLRYMQGLRCVLIAVVAVTAALAGHDLGTTPQILAIATAAYAAASVLTHAAWRVSRTGGLTLFGLMLLLDGVYLGWTSYITGGAASPVRFVIVLHVLTVALLASYRTGMKVTLWHSLLLLSAYYAETGGVIDTTPRIDAPGTPFEQLIAYIAILWLVAIATASFSAVNERELRRRRYDLEALAAFTARMEATSDPAAVACALVDSVADEFGFDRALLVGSQHGDGLYLPLASRPAIDAAYPAPPPPRSVLGRALAGREPVLVERLADDDAWLAEFLPGARNVMVVPLFADGRPIAALVGEHSLRSGSRIERRVVSMVERFAEHGAQVLHSAWLMQEIRRLATTDGLTGVANRQSFDAALAAELDRGARERLDVSLVLIDIDNFKRLNDSYGHQAGDAVLQRVAATLAATARSYDTVARYGGEEFAVILPGTSSNEAYEIADRLRAAVAAIGGEPAVTVSGGVATFPLGAADAVALIGAADGALYRSKGAGRNLVSVAAPALQL